MMIPQSANPFDGQLESEGLDLVLIGASDGEAPCTCARFIVRGTLVYRESRPFMWQRLLRYRINLPCGWEFVS